jgi:hypothetical protein
METSVLNLIDNVETFSQYMEQMESFQQSPPEYLLFRGQGTSKPLIPWIARKDQRFDSTEKERKMLSELRRRGSYLAGLNNMNAWELIVFAQHHEMQTRLLDWSSNPLVALWFACENEYNIKNDSSVFVLKASKDFLVNPEVDESPFSIKKTMILMPNLNNPRIIAQSGWFTVHPYSTKFGKFVELEKNKEVKGNISRITIPAKSKELMLERLSRCGVRSSTIFPDIIGLCKHMNWKFRQNE